MDSITPLREARIAAGLSMEALARRADVSMATVYRAEKSSAIRTSERTWRRLANALGVEVSAIRGHDAHDADARTRRGATPLKRKGAPTPA